MAYGNVIDFKGRTGYVRVAIETGVPIVPVVSIGAQETQLFLSRAIGWQSDWACTGSGSISRPSRSVCRSV
jgi:1-acyl-sn-glycerol-3-phosphate acyltransferase